MPAMQTALNVPIETLLDKIAEGAKLKDLVPLAGMSAQTLSVRLREHPGYQAARAVCLEERLDATQGAIETAEQGLDLARAREAWKAASWRAEREGRAIWGSDPALVINANGPMQIQIVSFAANVGQSENCPQAIEGEVLKK